MAAEKSSGRISPRGKQTVQVTGNTPARAGEGASTEFARKINRDAILKLVRQHQPISRVELARASSLQNSTVSSIVEQLTAEGWIREGEALKTARGRRPTQISLNDNLAMLVADVHPGRAILAAVDLNGQMLQQEEIKLSTNVQRSVLELGQALSALRSRLSVRKFMGVGVSIPGRVDTETGRLIIAPNLHWGDYDIRGALAKRLDMTVELENNANSCLLSELWFGHLETVRNAVLLSISEGVGAALLAEGHLIFGRKGLAGEFGHLCFDPAGPVCGCGRRGCWEVFASTRAALGYCPEHRGIDYQELSRLALAGDAAAKRAIERQASAIGRGLRMVTAALAPEIILFAGDIFYAWPLVLPILERECAEGLLAGNSPRLACTGDAMQAQLLGAAALVLQRHSGYYRSHSPVRTTSAQKQSKPKLNAAVS